MREGKRPKESTGAVVASKQFAATVRKKDGKSHLVITSPEFYQNELNKFKENEPLSLYVTNKKPRRSIQQNSYYWGVYLPLIAKETGESDVERLHLLFKGKFLTKAIVEVLGHKVRITGSTTSLSKSEFSEYIMAIESETGIAAPPVDIDG